MNEHGAAPEWPTGLRVQERQAGRGPAAARRAIDLAVGEDGHIALDEAGARFVGLGLPEDDPVGPGQLRLVRVTRVEPGVEGRAKLALEGDEPTITSVPLTL